MKCKQCSAPMIEDLMVTASGVFDVAVSRGKRIASNHRAGVRARMCPECNDVSLYVRAEDKAMIVNATKEN